MRAEAEGNTRAKMEKRRDKFFSEIALREKIIKKHDEKRESQFLAAYKMK